MAEFKDYFSTRSGEYSRFRPSYPPAVYQYLSGLCAGHDLAWDCATGSGQAARGLCGHFHQIVATDASAEQLRHAAGPDNVSFRVATAEQSGFETASVDLITVAQALHWFDHEAFFREVKRVVKPGGIIAAWSYNLLEITPEIDVIVNRFCEDTVGEYWPPGRRYVVDDYRTIAFPFAEVTMPPLRMTVVWSLDDLIGYLATWSAVTRYRAARGRDPMVDIYTELSTVWGPDTAAKKTVHWPLSFLVGKL
ncbi:MAG: class I SAM-dependent methyltransferase [Alphaproteobacteria bacterium]|nr:class I SAM-dependent methyltransferase [Alphaproteobacteria bacterium]